MIRKYRGVVMLVLILGLVGSVSADEYSWDNLDPDSNSFCVAANWNPDGNPGINDYVLIRPGSVGRQGPDVDCYVDVLEMEGPGGGQPMFIGSGGNFNIGRFWNWDDVGVYGIGDETSVNITQDPTVYVGGNWEIGERTNTPYTLNISGNPMITVKDNMLTTYDDTRTRFYLNMSGGTLNIGGRLSWGDIPNDTDFGLEDDYDRGGGGGELNVSGGATITCNTLAFTSGGRRDWTLNLDGGTIFVEGKFSAPGNDPALALADSNAFINIDSGTLECGSFDNSGYLYRMDINEGVFIIHGDNEANMIADVAAGYITAYNGAEDVLVEVVDGNTIVRADVIVVKASAPSPEDYSLSECPGVELSWTAGAQAKATQGHDVYFGTDINDVTDANTAAGLGVYMGRQDSTVYPESGTLTVELGTTYYWRVDEIGDSNVWTGDVWQFTISDGTASEPYPVDLAITVDPYVVLEWSSGCDTDSHDVYLGTNFDDVGNATTATADLFKGNQPGTAYDPPGALDYFTYYYWRIDEVEDSNKYKGKVWQFRTGSYIPDENQVLWYKFDETGGGYVFDSSGYEHHGSIYGIASNWEPNNGHTDGCLDFAGDGHVNVPKETLDSVTDSITVAVWLNGYNEDDDMVVFDTGDDDKLRGMVPTAGPELDVYWRAGNDTNDLLLWEQATPQKWQDEWHHYAFVKDETAGAMKIYFDGIVAQSKTGTTNSLANVKNTTFRIGSKNTSNSDYDGKMDDFRVYDRALSDAEIAGLFIGGDIQQPWGPQPFNGETEVIRDTILSWRSGQGIVFHDVYLGTDLDAVTDANTAVPLGVYKGRQNIDANSYDPGGLELGTTYYWRIDEVNDADANSPWSRIWTFTVANYIIIDDFESYNDSDNLVYSTWLEGGSAWLDLGFAGDPAQSGTQSMDFLYFNNTNYGGGYYSEAGRALGGMDFTQADVKVLTVFFYGNPTNVAGGTEEPYVGIDDAGTYAESAYTDTNTIENPHLITDIQQPEWHQWDIPISDLNAVTLTSVQHVYIGFGQRGSAVQGGTGEVYFDDVRLYPPKCIPELGPEWDFSGNCIVDMADVGIMGEQWLRADALLDIQAPTVGPVAWWELDDGSGTTATDSSVNSNTGTLEGSTTWVTGHIGTGAVDFAGDDARIRVPHSSELMPANTISVTVWLRASEEPDGYSARVVAKGIDNDDWEAYYMQFTEDRQAQWTIRDPNHNNHGIGSGRLGLNEWVHVAGTYDGDALKLYINGQLDAEDTTGGVAILQDSNDLSIGNRSDGNDRAFVGTIDDVRVYDYALSADEVAYIATQGTGYMALTSQANIYDTEPQGQKAVNFRDLAKLMTSWLEEKLYPE